MRQMNPSRRMAAILQKIDKSSYLGIDSTDYHEIWHDDTEWLLLPVGS